MFVLVWTKLFKYIQKRLFEFGEMTKRQVET